MPNVAKLTQDTECHLFSFCPNNVLISGLKSSKSRLFDTQSRTPEHNRRPAADLGRSGRWGAGSPRPQPPGNVGSPGRMCGSLSAATPLTAHMAGAVQTAIASNPTVPYHPVAAAGPAGRARSRRTAGRRRRRPPAPLPSGFSESSRATATRLSKICLVRAVPAGRPCGSCARVARYRVLECIGRRPGTQRCAERSAQCRRPTAVPSAKLSRRHRGG